MSQYEKDQFMSDTVITAAVRAAFWDSRAKRLALELPCSIVTGKRVASTGRIAPGRRLKLVRLLRRRLEINRLAMDEIDAQLKAIEDGETQAQDPAGAAARVGRVA
jgi:hypothetical protein